MLIACMLVIQPDVHPNFRKLKTEILRKQTARPVLELAALVGDANDFPRCLAPAHELVVFEESGRHA